MYAMGNSSTDFNSIKVQLKRFGIDKPLVRIAFQFHKGTIKATDKEDPVIMTGISIP